MTPKPKTLDQQIQQLQKEITQLHKEIQQLEQQLKPNRPLSDKPKKRTQSKKFVAPLPTV